MSKFGRKQRQPPEGFDYVEPTLTALENELREKVNEPHEGLRKTESQWPIHQINWQKSRYVYDLYYTYGRISRAVYDYCIENKIVDAALIAKWKKSGYERLCSTYAINPKNYKFGTVSICRVPASQLPANTQVEDPATGCRGCASGSGGNIFGNKYGQYLAAIQIAREKAAGGGDEDDEGEGDGRGGGEGRDDLDQEDQDDDNQQIVGLPVDRKTKMWADDDENAAALKELAGETAAAAATAQGAGGPPGKRSRHDD